jgi:tetratricopeptide (TPR) repeat protein
MRPRIQPRASPNLGSGVTERARRRPGDAPRLTSWTTRLLAVALALAASALFFVLLETGLRAVGYGDQTDFFVRIPGRDLYTTNQKYGWRFFPRALARTPVVGCLPSPKPPGTYRIFVLGESAAMGVPEPAFSFGRILEAMLRDQYPEVKFEVINAAMTAINSHVILPIAHDCARQQGDLFIIYMGNNEVVGPYGAGTIFQNASSPSRRLIRASIWARGTRTGQLLKNTTALLGRRAEEPREWGGMAMFLKHLVPADDPRLSKVYDDFRANLTDISRAALHGGARVILSTVPTNLRDNPPFASVHRRGLSDAERSRWEAIYSSAIELERAGEQPQAVEKYLEAAKLDDRFAELHYRLGRCLLALKRPQEARQHYVLARDLDALRFRADSRINSIIREVAVSMQPEGGQLLDAELAFEQSPRTADGIPGEGLFYEHVHPNFAGNYLLAEAACQKVIAVLPKLAARLGTPVTPPSFEDTAAVLPLTGWDRYKMAAGIFALMDQPPFTSQLEAPARRARGERQLIELRDKYTTAQALGEARAAYGEALRRRPDDVPARLRLAELLRECGDHAGAARQWRTLIQLVPGVASWHASLGDALRDQGELEQAAQQAEQALRIDPELATAHFSLGSVLDRQGKLEKAAASYSQALRLRPNYAEAHNNLGLVLTRRGEIQQAMAHYSEALRIKPDFAEAHNNLGVAYSKLGQTRQAIAHFSAALEIKPDFAQAHYDLGSSLADLGQTPEAIRHYEQALQAQPTYAEAHFGLAAAMASMGQIQPAIAHYREAVRINPGYAEAHNNLGAALARLGQAGPAIEHLSRALALRPEFAGAHFNLGVVLAGQGRLEEAISHFSEALRIQPDFTAARQRLDSALARLPR